MKKYKLLFLILILLLTSCSTNNKTTDEFDLTPENAIQYITEDYKFGESDFIKEYVNNEFVTNEVIIDLLADNFSICSVLGETSENIYLVEVDNNRQLNIIILIDDNKIQKIRIHNK